MSGELEKALIEQEGKQVYERAANRVLAGFQLIEDWLKTYLQVHFDLTRLMVAGRLHFEFRRDDYQNVSLGKLTSVFSKLCANEQLIADLNAVISRRNHIAHRAFLKLYDTKLTSADYSNLLTEFDADHAKVASLLSRLNDELRRLGTAK